MSEIMVNMTRSLESGIPQASFPDGYNMIAINEETGYLWEQVMDKSFGDYLAGTYRYVMVANHNYNDDQVFVMLNQAGEPISSAALWYTGDKWVRDNYGAVIFVCVAKDYQGNKYGEQMVYYVLDKMRQTGITVAELGVVSDNYPALKTYLNCGFIPLIANEEDQVLWKNIYSYFSLEAPVGGFKKNIQVPFNDQRLLDMTPELPHPPRPWPYQIAQFHKAIKNHETYVFGIWYRFNLYMVDKEVYINLKEIIMQSDYSEEIVCNICENKVNNIFADYPVSPKALLVENYDGRCYLIGKTKDKRFIEGINNYFDIERRSAFEQEGKKLIFYKDK